MREGSVGLKGVVPWGLVNFYDIAGSRYKKGEKFNFCTKLNFSYYRGLNI